MKTYLDTETCGLHSMPVLLQYAYDDGDVRLWDIWLRPVGDTLELLEQFAASTVVGFNLAFDWFHVCKLYTIWQRLPRYWRPIEHIDAVAEHEAPARFGPCIKPAGALDLMLHARRGPYQSLMARDDIRIRKVPIALAYPLAAELEKRVELDDIYFARSKNPDAPRWKVYPHDDREWADVVLKFKPAGGLKYLAEHALGYEATHFDEVAPPSKPDEMGYKPWGSNWPELISEHVEHWQRPAPRRYATDDVVITRKLDAFFGYPEPNDNDSVLACMVPAVRWRGFEIDTERLTKLQRAACAVVAAAPCNVNAPNAIRAYLGEVLDDTEKLLIAETTEKAKLKAIAAWDGHPAAERAAAVLKVKTAVKEIELYAKLLAAGRFHPDFSVGGTRSWRMSGGSSGLNSQGIQKTAEVRSCFPLKWGGYQLCGGDFDAFEVSLAEAVYADPDLRAALLDGKKIHGLFGESLFPGYTYEQILASAKTADDKYTPAKSGVFALLYGGDAGTLSRNLGIPLDTAEAAFAAFGEQFPGVAKAQESIRERFGALRQPDGIGSQVFWHEPADYCESFLGFRRYFTLENKIARTLFEMGSTRWWPSHERKTVERRAGRRQTLTGAATSAVFGAAFAIVSANIRAATNHEIQSPGGQITKHVQRRIWDVQPAGVSDFRVAPLNIHDEIMAVVDPEYVDAVRCVVTDTVESYRDRVPLIGMEWQTDLATWADK